MNTNPHITPPADGEAAHVYVERLLRAAAQAKASGIYFIPSGSTLTVICQTESGKHTIAELTPSYGRECINRLKVLGSVLTYQTRSPQDGVIHGLPDAAEAEFRLATLPTIHGERMTVRILNQSESPRTLDALGFSPEVLSSLSRMLTKPEGMLVLTGPTGSGKTTVIYAGIRMLLDIESAPATIISIEDPVEMDLCIISQVSVSRNSAECDYEAALRAALRQDVKTLVIGEMRDKGVVRTALEAALTGHRILTTFHAGDIAAVYGRMLHMGFEPFLIGAAIAGVINQRLVPRLCSHCRAPVPIKSDSLRDAGVEDAFEGTGCDRCGHSGTNGFFPLAAVLESDPNWCDFIATRPSLGELREALSQRPLANLPKAAVRAVQSGSISEAAALNFLA